MFLRFERVLRVSGKIGHVSYKNLSYNKKSMYEEGVLREHISCGPQRAFVL